MPAWLKKIEDGMDRGGVTNKYALLNSMGIKRGSKTVVDEAEAQQKMRSYGRHHGGKRKREVSATEAGDAMARHHKGR